MDRFLSRRHSSFLTEKFRPDDERHLLIEVQCHLAGLRHLHGIGSGVGENHAHESAERLLGLRVEVGHDRLEVGLGGAARR